MQRLPRLIAPLLAVALCVLAAWWAMRLMPGATIAIPPAADVGSSAGGSRVDAVLASARLFGSRRPGVLSDNVRALGVVADASGRGSVIVSVDGQAPKVYRVGDTLDGRLVSAIRPDEIELEAGGARQVFRLPPSRVAATGLTILGSGPAPAAISPASPGMPGPSQPPMPAPQPLSMPPPMQGRPFDNASGMPQGTLPRRVPQSPTGVPATPSNR